MQERTNPRIVQNSYGHYYITYDEQKDGASWGPYSSLLNAYDAAWESGLKPKGNGAPLGFGTSRVWQLAPRAVNCPFPVGACICP